MVGKESELERVIIGKDSELERSRNWKGVVATTQLKRAITWEESNRWRNATREQCHQEQWHWRIPSEHTLWAYPRSQPSDPVQFAKFQLFDREAFNDYRSNRSSGSKIAIELHSNYIAIYIKFLGWKSMHDKLFGKPTLPLPTATSSTLLGYRNAYWLCTKIEMIFGFKIDRHWRAWIWSKKIISQLIQWSFWSF